MFASDGAYELEIAYADAATVPRLIGSRDGSPLIMPSRHKWAWQTRPLLSRFLFRHSPVAPWRNRSMSRRSPSFPLAITKLLPNERLFAELFATPLATTVSLNTPLATASALTARDTSISLAPEPSLLAANPCPVLLLRPSDCRGNWAEGYLKVLPSS
jgi:hypothetical protein